jgi:uncharacterized protein YcfL
MKRLIRLVTLLLLATFAFAACSSSQPEVISNPDGPLVQVFHPPT